MSFNNKNYQIAAIGLSGAFNENNRITLGEELNLTGCEISVNRYPAHKTSSFVHSHKLNDEIYIIISGDGLFMVDNEEFSVQTGQIVKISPAGERAIKAGDDGLTYICIQVQVDSLTQSTENDGVISAKKASWM